MEELITTTRERIVDDGRNRMRTYKNVVCSKDESPEVDIPGGVDFRPNKSAYQFINYL